MTPLLIPIPTDNIWAQSSIVVDQIKTTCLTSLKYINGKIKFMYRHKLVLMISTQTYVFTSLIYVDYASVSWF